MSSKRGLIYVALIGFFQIQGVKSSCINSSVTVSRMCQKSVVTGTLVYIDADAAGSTTLSSGVPCTCSVTTKGVKQMGVQSNFIGTSTSQCGTKMEYTGLPGGNLSHSCDDITFNVTTQTNMIITVGVRKDQAPHLSQYCISFQLQTCTPGFFQCNDGGCIPYASIRNSYPDCKDGSDEVTSNCGDGGICSEGLALCEGGKGCRPQGGRCNNITECKDGSDEIGCDTLSVISTTEAPPNESNTTTHLITVTCTESDFLPQTTMATTPQTTTAPTTTFSPTTSSETQQNISISVTIVPTTTPIISIASSVLSSSPPNPTTSARSSTAIRISTSTERTDYSKPLPDPMPPWLIAVIVCVCALVIFAVVFAIIRHRTSTRDHHRPDN